MITFAYADNSEAVAKSLGEFQDAMADQQPALTQIADDFRGLIAEQFASEGRAAGTPWAARKTQGGADIARYAMSAKRKSQTWRRTAMSAPPDAPLLVRTGALRDSLTQPVAAGHVAELDRQTLTMGSRLPYALFHQTGTRRMPARPIIVLRDDRSQKWTEFIRAAIEEKTQLLGAKELA
jgi:phage gpG-like protein